MMPGVRIPPTIWARSLQIKQPRPSEAGAIGKLCGIPTFKIGSFALPKKVCRPENRIGTVGGAFSTLVWSICSLVAYQATVSGRSDAVAICQCDCLTVSRVEYDRVFVDICRLELAHEPAQLAIKHRQRAQVIGIILVERPKFWHGRMRLVDCMESQVGVEVEALREC